MNPDTTHTQEPTFASQQVKSEPLDNPPELLETEAARMIEAAHPGIQIPVGRRHRYALQAAALFGFVLLVYEVLFSFDIYLSSLFDQYVSILIPTMLFLLVLNPDLRSRARFAEFAGFRRVDARTVGLTLLIFVLFVPASYLLIEWVVSLFGDTFSELYDPNEVELGFWFNLFAMCVAPAVCEELMFRGAILPLLGRAKLPIIGSVLLSSIAFGIFHMNVAQALYTTHIGILLALLVLASGSIWPSMLFHLLFNALTIEPIYSMVEAFAPMYLLYRSPLHIQLIVFAGMSIAVALLLLRMDQHRRSHLQAARTDAMHA